MKNPDAINLMTPKESRARGWSAESRDAHGHLCSNHAQFDDDAALIWYVRECIDRGQTVTIWPDPILADPSLPDPCDW